jgi:hypothetical protein
MISAGTFAFYSPVLFSEQIDCKPLMVGLEWTEPKHVDCIMLLRFSYWWKLFSLTLFGEKRESGLVERHVTFGARIVPLSLPFPGVVVEQ